MSEEAASTSKIPGQPLEAIRCECGTTVSVGKMEPLSTVECPKCHARFPATVKLGNFLLLSRLGSGAMGDVYEAKDRTLGRHVAIKVIGGKATVSEKTIRDFVGEARTLAQLNHRNVVQIHSIGVEEDHPYLVMELVGAGRLDQYIVRDMPGDERTVLTFGIDAARGLEAASNGGLIHGDVKPANILINEDGVAKIVDFGLARFAENQIEGKVYGTPFYIAPELLEGTIADFRSDMYSLGCSLYHVLAGRPPFRAKKVKEIVRARLLAPAPDVREFSPDVSEYTSYIFTRVLAKNPDDRYVDYDEFVQDLTYALQLLDAGATGVPGPLPPPPSNAGNEYADSAADLSELDAAVSHSEREALTSRGHSHRRHGAGHGRSRGRDKKRRSRLDSQSLSASHTHMEGLESQAGKNKKLGVIIAIGVLVIAVGVTLGVVFMGGSPGEKDGSKDDGPDTTGVSFTDTFSGNRLDPLWKHDGIGGMLPGSQVLRLTDPGSDPRRDAIVSRQFGPGSFSADIKIKAIQWAGRGEELRFEIMQGNSSGLKIVVLNDQGDCRIECEAVGPGKTNTAPSAKFGEKPPSALSLSVRWSAETGLWSVQYGINGAPPETRIEPINQVGAPDPTRPRTLRLVANQFGSNGVTSMDIDAVAINFE